MLFNERKFNLKRGLQEFWRDQDLGSTPAPPEEDIGAMLTAFFPRLAELHARAESTETKFDLVDEVIKSPSALSETQKALKSIVSWAWDGLKRAWRGLVNLFRRAVRAVGQFFINLARLLKVQIQKAAPTVWAAWRGLEIALKYLLNPCVTGPAPIRFAALRQADGDLSLWCAPHASPSQIRSFSLRLSLASRLFELSTRILAALCRLFFTVLRGAVFILGWLAAILAIYRLWKSFAELRTLGQAARDLVKLYDEAQTATT